jgi:superfamily I DNA/RNA helicase
MTGVLLGPPGTGKTEASTTLAERWLRKGHGPASVAYLSYTRAAAQAAAERIARGEMDERRFKEEFPLFRTIHSLAYKALLEAKPDLRVLTRVDMRAFAKETGYGGKFVVPDWEDLVEHGREAEVAPETHWDMAHLAYSVGRLRARSGDEMAASRNALPRSAIKYIGFLEENVYLAFVTKYEAWKAREGVVDFTDMLEFALTEAPPVSACRYVVIDEAQDLGPAMHGIVDRLFPMADEIVWVGDEDQAIYSFSGASSSLFLERARTASWVMKLTQTHRFGQGIADFSARIIRRVKERIEKNVVGRPDRGGRASLSGGFKPVAGPHLILHRHVAGCREVARAYVEAGLPFRNERGRDPLSLGSRVKAWRALDLLASGAKAALVSARLIVEDLLPSMAVDESDVKIRLVVHGAKKGLDEKHGNDLVSLADMVAMKILTPDGAEAVKTKRYSLMKHRDDLEYYDRVTRNGYPLEARWPVITTIHGSKGRQAPHVILFAEASRRCRSDPDGEHRLAYVGATRTEGDVDICVERKVDWADSPYTYPVEAD